MIKKSFLLVFFVLLTVFPYNAFADQFLFGVGLMTESGQPDYDTDRFPIFVAYESKELWRFSFTNTAYEHKDDPARQLEANILAAEKMWVYKIKSGLSAIGGFGPGYFMAKHETPSGSGSAFGISATGSIRFAVSSSFFLEGSLQYRNCAVTIDDVNIDAGYSGLMLAAGFFF